MGGREKVSLSLMCFVAPIEPPIGLMVTFYRSGCAILSKSYKNIAVPIMAMPIMLLCFFSYIRYVLKISYI